MLGVEYVKGLYDNDNDLKLFIENVKNLNFEIYRLDRYLFKENKLCVPNSSVRELLDREAHSGGLMGHFGVKKTLDTLHKHFFCPKMRRDVERIYSRCITCRKDKSRVFPNDLYTSILVPTTHWVDISMDFVLRLHRSKRGMDFIS